MPKFLLLCGLFLSALRSAGAWDAAAHEIVASLAGQQLNPRARQTLDDLARAMSTPVRAYDAVTLSCWMDDLRNNDLPLPDHGRFFTWHYIDLGVDPGDPLPSFTPGDDNDYHGNAVQGLKRALVVLRGGTDPYLTSRGMAAAITLHLVGDLHQPLHAATHYFYTPGGWRHHDSGGNKEEVLNGPADEMPFNLHRFWDTAWRASFDPLTGRVVLDERFRDHEGHAFPDLGSGAKTIAATPLPVADLEPHFEVWAQESNRLAREFVYRQITATESRKTCRLGSTYVVHAHAVACQRILLAAHRLAVLLNETIGSDLPVAPPAPYPGGPGPP